MKRKERLYQGNSSSSSFIKQTPNISIELSAHLGLVVTHAFCSFPAVIDLFIYMSKDRPESLLTVSTKKIFSVSHTLLSSCYSNRPIGPCCHCCCCSPGAVNRIKEIITNGVVKAATASTSSSSFSPSGASVTIYQQHNPPPPSLPQMNHKPHFQSGVRHLCIVFTLMHHCFFFIQDSKGCLCFSLLLLDALCSG